MYLTRRAIRSPLFDIPISTKYSSPIRRNCVRPTITERTRQAVSVRCSRQTSHDSPREPGRAPDCVRLALFSHCRGIQSRTETVRRSSRRCRESSFESEVTPKHAFVKAFPKVSSRNERSDSEGNPTKFPNVNIPSRKLSTLQVRFVATTPHFEAARHRRELGQTRCESFLVDSRRSDRCETGSLFWQARKQDGLRLEV